METVWEALYCPCTEESASMTISIHKTKEGAERAIRIHRLNELSKYEALCKHDPGSFDIKDFGEYQDWNVLESKLFE